MGFQKLYIVLKLAFLVYSTFTEIKALRMIQDGLTVEIVIETVNSLEKKTDKVKKMLHCD